MGVLALGANLPEQSKIEATSGQNICISAHNDGIDGAESIISPRSSGFHIEIAV